MKKIIATAAILVLSTMSANAVNWGALSLTGGIATNTSVWGASAKETNLTDTNTTGHIKKESGVFTDSFSSQFIELGIGSWISLGFEHTPDAISTPENKTREGTVPSTVKVDFNDVNTTYIKVNFPNGIYFKTGTVETDLDIKESMGSGSTYKNKSTEGTMMGLGYQRFMGDTGFGFRLEGSYTELDNVSTDNGVSATGATVANGGRNTIDASNLEGLVGKVALTYTFGRD